MQRIFNSIYIEILLNLLSVMQEQEVYHLVFSSSATVYGHPKTLPIKETDEPSPINPYGRTKQISEQILWDLADSDKNWRFMSLRLFNPLGAHKSGDLGENPNGVPNGYSE